MNMNEFYQVLSEAKKDCYIQGLDSVGVIRIFTKDELCKIFCPITYVAYKKLNKFYRTVDAKAASVELGPEIANNRHYIMLAADAKSMFDKDIMETREKLIAVLS